MFVTVTANPSVDRTIEVGRLVRGGLHRASGVRVNAGGKGINVARALVLNGRKARAILPAGGAVGAHLLALLSEYNIDVVPVPSGSVRCNVTVVEPDATITKLNEPGGTFSLGEGDALRNSILRNIGDAECVAIGGSLPPGLALGWYAELVEQITASGAKAVVDTSGLALRAAVAARPALVKPNRHELEEAVGRGLRTLGDVVDAAEELRESGAVSVLASLGSNGAILVQDDGAWHAEAPAQACSNVGAGDATLAGFLAAGARGPQALADAVAWGAAAVSLPGSIMPGPVDVRAREVTVHRAIDRALPLTDNH